MLNNVLHFWTLKQCFTLLGWGGVGWGGVEWNEKEIVLEMMKGAVLKRVL